MNDEPERPDEDNGRPFTPSERRQTRELIKNGFTREEIKTIRALMEREERIGWLYRTLRSILLWVFGVVAAIVAFRDQVKSFMQGGTH